MRDGRTVKRTTAREARARLGRLRATLVVLEGGAAGTEHVLAGPRRVLGRGPEVDLAFEDEEMSQQHLSLEWCGESLHLTDLGSTNGTRVNGEAVSTVQLDHGDLIAFGRHVLQLLLEKDDAPPPTYVSEDA